MNNILAILYCLLLMLGVLDMTIVLVGIIATLLFGPLVPAMLVNPAFAAIYIVYLMVILFGRVKER